MRELIYYVAGTVDGFIAQEDGSFDGMPWDEAYLADLGASFPETFPVHLREVLGVRGGNKWFDIVLMGRKTYEEGLKVGSTSPYPTMRQYVFSRTMEESLDEQVELVSENAVEVVSALKQETGKAIWLCGGANLAATLFAGGLIDKIILKLNPVVFGRGIPLFSGPIQLTNLELTDSKIYSSGHVLLHYRVKPRSTRRKSFEGLQAVKRKT